VTDSLLTGGNWTPYVEYWRNNRLQNIKPSSLRYGEFPEGWDARDIIKRIVTPFIHQSIVEIGCGYGRLCQAFSPDAYLGLDINEEAIEKAQNSNPTYRFQVIDYVGSYPPADVYLAYTVFLHIEDLALAGILKKMAEVTSTIIVAEILTPKKPFLSSWWGRRATSPRQGKDPWFPRTRENYEALLRSQNFLLDEEIRRSYFYYPHTEISFLIFRKAPLPPSHLSRFPEDLSTPYLQYSGLYEDGWLTDKVFLRLHQTTNHAYLVIQGTFPQIDSGRSPTSLMNTVKIVLNGKQIHQETIQPGEFVIQCPVSAHQQSTLNNQVGLIELSFSKLQQLPSPDQRRVSVLLKFIGFTS